MNMTTIDMNEVQKMTRTQQVAAMTQAIRDMNPELFDAVHATVKANVRRLRLAELQSYRYGN